MKKLILTIVVAFATLYSNAQPGSLDLTFDGDGKLTTVIGSYNEDMGSSVAIQTDGKIVVAGYSLSSSNGLDDDFTVVRYNTDGSLDNTFDFDGKVTTAFGTNTDRVNSVAIQTDGKIVVAGYYWLPNVDFAVTRYNTDGSLDNTFDFDGKVTTAVGTSVDEGNSVAIQSDGKIVVAGQAFFVANEDDFAVVRYNSDGSVDFKQTTDFSNNIDRGSSIAIQTDGKIVVAGTSYNGTDYNFAVARYNSNGILDNTFDGDGKLITVFGSGNDIGRDIAIQTDGKIIVAGTSYNGTNDDFAVVRYNSDGSLDNTFDTDGKLTTDIGGNTDYGRSLSIQPDGKIVVSGESKIGTNNFDFAVARYNTDGSLDNTFDSDGKVTTDYSGSDDYGASVAIQTDEKIVVAGTAAVGGIWNFAVARYLGGTTGIKELTPFDDFIIYPNPFFTQTVLQTDKIFKDATLTVYNTFGQIVKQIKNISGQTVTLHRDNFPCGMYFYQLTDNGKIIGQGKFIIE